MKRKALASAVALAYLTLVIGGVAIATSGGVGDGIKEYDCAGSCHATAGTGTITATASTLSPTVGQSLTVTITFTPAELSSTKVVGVFLVRQLATSNSLPSVDGWQIQGDPNGGTNNYAEKVATAISTPVTFTWSLTAPTTAGIYHLYARAHHGASPSAILYQDFASGLSFTVRLPGFGDPSIQHQPPLNVRPGTQILIDATLVNTTGAILKWRNSGMTSPATITMTNTSTPSGQGWRYQAVIPAQNTTTEVTYDIVASNAAGNVTSSFSISVSEGGGQQGITWDQQVLWAISVLAVVIVIAGATILISMLFKRRLSK